VLISSSGAPATNGPGYDFTLISPLVGPGCTQISLIPLWCWKRPLTCQSCQLKPKADPKLYRRRNIQCSQRLTVSTKFHGIVNGDISSQLVENIYRGHVAEPANRTNNNKSLRSTVVKVKRTPTFQPTDSRLSSGQMETRAGKHWNPLNACDWMMWW